MNEMIADLFDTGSALGRPFLDRLLVVLNYPFNPEQRIFVVWLFTSLVFALFVFFRSPPEVRTGQGG